MKRAFITLVFLALVSLSCNKDGSGIFTYCFTCTTTLTTTVSPSLSGYPQTTKSSTDECNITEKQARELESLMTKSTTTTSSGYTITVKAVCKCVKK